MTDTPVTRFPGVTRRPDSTVWWFVLRAPTELRHRFGGSPWAARHSLGTSDLSAANDLARGLQAEWAGKFTAMRKQENPERVALTPALVADIVAEVRRWTLTADDNLRNYPEGPDALLAMERRKAEAAATQGLTIPTDDAGTTLPRPYLLGGLSDGQQGVVAKLNAYEAASAATAMIGRDRLSVLPLAEMVTGYMGLSIDWKSADGAAGLLEVLKVHRQATADLVRRDAGEAVETPTERQAAALAQEGPHRSAGGPAGAQQGHSPMDAFDAWDKLKPGARPRKTVETYRSAAKKLTAMLGGTTLEAMTREDRRSIAATRRQ